MASGAVQRMGIFPPCNKMHWHLLDANPYLKIKQCCLGTLTSKPLNVHVSLVSKSGIWLQFLESSWWLRFVRKQTHLPLQSQWNLFVNKWAVWPRFEQPIFENHSLLSYAPLAKCTICCLHFVAHIHLCNTHLGSYLTFNFFFNTRVLFWNKDSQN